MIYVEIFGLLCAVVALIVGLVHIREIHSTLKTLHDVQDSLSTRFIGQFPEFFPEIVTLLKSAKREIVIFCDLPAYASFSDPHTFLDYQQTLERKIKDEEVRTTLTCLGPAFRQNAIVEQFFGNGVEWNEWKNHLEHKKSLRRFLALHKRTTPIDELAKEEFLKILEAIGNRTIEDTLAGAEVRQIDTYIPLYFWLIDGMDAVFSIPSSDEITLEYGFATTDQKLISALVEMRDQYHRVAEKRGTESGSHLARSLLPGDPRA